MGRGNKTGDMNIELLNKIKSHVLEEPKRVWMGDWRIRWGDQTEISVGMRRGIDWEYLLQLSKPSCGTTACIAGWAVELGGDGDMKGFPYELRGRKLGFPYELRGRKLLGLNSYAQSDRLFYVASWPEQFRKRLAVAPPQSHEYAQVVADRIDWFVKTEGRE